MMDVIIPAEQRGGRGEAGEDGRGRAVAGGGEEETEKCVYAR